MCIYVHACAVFPRVSSTICSTCRRATHHRSPPQKSRFLAAPQAARYPFSIKVSYNRSPTVNPIRVVALRVAQDENGTDDASLYLDELCCHPSI